MQEGHCLVCDLIKSGFQFDLFGYELVGLATQNLQECGKAELLFLEHLVERRDVVVGIVHFEQSLLDSDLVHFLLGLAEDLLIFLSVAFDDLWFWGSPEDEILLFGKQGRHHKRFEVVVGLCSFADVVGEM